MRCFRALALVAALGWATAALLRARAEAPTPAVTAVRDRDGLQNALGSAVPFVVIEAHLNVSSAVGLRPGGVWAAFSVGPSISAILGNCTDAAPQQACTITASALSTVFAVPAPLQQLWVSRLHISLIRLPGVAAAKARAVFLVSGEAVRLWLTHVVLVAQPAPPSERETLLTTCYTSLSAVRLAELAKAYIADSVIEGLESDAGPVAWVELGGSVALHSTTLSANRARRGGLFKLPAQPPVPAARALRLWNVSFSCNPVQSCVAAPLSAGVVANCVGHTAPGGRVTVRPLLTWEDVQSATLGNGLCAPAQEAAGFLNGSEPALLSFAQALALTPPPGPSLEELSSSGTCVRLDPCAAPPVHMQVCHADAFPAKGVHSGAGSSVMMFVLVGGLGVMGFTILSVTLLNASVQSRQAVARREPAWEINMTELGPLVHDPDERSFSDEDSLLSFTLEQNPGCLCRTFPAGDERCLLCPICLRPFAEPSDDAGRPDLRPKALPCGHSVCAHCVTTIDGAIGYAHLRWTAAKKQQLPVNYLAMDMLPVASGGDQPAPPTAPGLCTLRSGLRSFRARSLLPAPVPAPQPVCLHGRNGNGSRSLFSVQSARPPSGKLGELVSFTSAPHRPPPAAGKGQAVTWQPEEEACFCPICYDVFSSKPPPAPSTASTGPTRDLRPVLFPCGHGACADCAAKILQFQQCYKRCEWTVDQLSAPFALNWLVMAMLDLSARKGGSVVLTLSERVGSVARASLAQQLQSVAGDFLLMEDDAAASLPTFPTPPRPPRPPVATYNDEVTESTSLLAAAATYDDGVGESTSLLAAVERAVED